MNKNKVSLQINLSPSDLPVCKKLLQRQIHFWLNELDEIVFSVESKKSFGKFAKDFDKNRSELLYLIEGFMERYPQIRYHFIDYSNERNAWLSNLFFDGRRIPEKDFRGCAFYAYLDGLASCKNKYVIHMDADMIIGGTPDAWLQDAVDLLNSDPNYLIINPLAGPPSADLDIKQKYVRGIGRYQFLFDKMSTRLFLIDMDKLLPNKLELSRVPLTMRNMKWAMKSKFNWGYKALEDLFSDMMIRKQLYRVDTLGKETGGSCYTLHPVIKPAPFIESIPQLLERIDKDDIPASQRGYYNVCDDFFDFRKYRKSGLFN